MALKSKLLILVAACLLAGCQVVDALLPAPSSLPPTQPPAPTRTPAPTQVFPTSPPTIAPSLPATPTRASSSTPQPTGTATPVVLGLVKFPPDVNPLTGLKVNNPEILNRRPVMIKVSNYPATMRPHAGLSAADIVFEYYIGEYANRFSAIYYSQDAKKIGPLRSGRLIDADLALAYGSVLIYGNADPRVDEVLVKALASRAVTFDDAPCPPVCGKETHDTAGVWVDSSAVNAYLARQGIDNSRQELSGLVFDVRQPTNSKPGTFLGAMFGPEDRGEWRYDPASGQYLRWIEEIRSGNKLVMIPLVDRNTNKQLAFTNIIILFARHTELLPTMFEVEVNQNTLGQRVIYFRDGVMSEGIWRMRDPEKPIQLLNPYGLPFALKPGPSWIIIVGLGSEFFEKQPGQYELEYHTK